MSDGRQKKNQRSRKYIYFLKSKHVRQDTDVLPRICSLFYIKQASEQQQNRCNTGCKNKGMKQKVCDVYFKNQVSSSKLESGPLGGVSASWCTYTIDIYNMRMTKMCHGVLKLPRSEDREVVVRRRVPDFQILPTGRHYENLITHFSGPFLIILGQQNVSKLQKIKLLFS